MGLNELEVFIGWDARARTAWQVCERSLQHHAADPVPVRAIGRKMLQNIGAYTRLTSEVDGKLLDHRSNEFCSTDFSLARFWVPQLAGRAGWALYCDSDFLFRADVREILEHADPRYAVMVVPHQHEPTDTSKMNAQQQTAYFRKNWSSLMLWNLAHAGCQRLSPHDLNTWHKHDLHGFRWLASNEIGFLPEPWNWLVGVSPTLPPSEPYLQPPKAVHFTNGTPDMKGYERMAYADEWRSYQQPAERVA
jgi:lipopolysaccharide biosynthesis glycosyltransferase